MSLLLSFMTAIQSHYRQLQHTYSPERVQFNHRSGLIICSYGLILSIIALFGTATGGYHFAFTAINASGISIPPWLLQNLTTFGDGTFILSLVLLFATRKIPFHWAVLIAAVIGGITSNVLKNAFDAPRPPSVLTSEAFHLVGKAYTRHSFPSGHTLTAFLMASVCAAFTRKALLQITFLFLASLVGLSRVWLGVHWPADILVGAALGCFIGFGASYVSARFSHIYGSKSHIFTLLLLVIACYLNLTTPNDYPLAQPLISAIALAALIRFVWIYCFPAQACTQINAYLTTRFAITQSSGFWLTLIVLMFTGYRLWVMAQPHLQLFYDETYYYHWSLNPDLGYYSKPPMVAWAIIIGTHLLGDNLWGLKIMAPLLYAASALCIYGLTARIANTRAAVAASLIFLSSPLIAFNSEFITTDAPLIFFWSASLYTFFIALDKNHWRWWLLLGITTGLGMLSKYTMAPLPVALFAFMLASKNHRPRLLTPKPWLAAIVAGAIFSLNLYWNMENGWIAFKHTQEISHTDHAFFNLGSLATFVVTQFFVLGPISSWMLIKALASRNISDADNSSSLLSAEHRTALIYACAGILLLIGVQALLSHAFPNWAGPWIVGASVLLGALGSQYFADQQWRWLKHALIVNLILAGLFYHWPQVLQAVNIERTANNDPYKRVLGWRELTALIQPQIDAHPQHILASDSRDLLAYIGFYGKPGSFNFARWNPNPENIRDYYDLKANMRLWQDKPEQRFLYIANKPLSDQQRSRFTQTHDLGEYSVNVYQGLTRRIYLYELKGFLGYE